MTTLSAPTTRPATVQVTTDPTWLLSALSKAFTEPANVCYEIIQNCGRADATQIDVEYDAEPGVLGISDNGCGITDWPVLLAIARSGWDEATRKTNLPYGRTVGSSWLASITGG